MTFNKSEIFKTAWRFIREGLSRSAAFVKAWAIAKGAEKVEKAKEETIAILEKLGGNLWEKGNFSRVYFDAEDFGFELTYYKSGNIQYAELNGEHVSNAYARRVLCGKYWYDLKEGKFMRKTDSVDARDFAKVIEAKVMEALA